MKYCSIKLLGFLSPFFISSVCLPANTWYVKIQNEQTNEVKKYEFSDYDNHQLDIPKDVVKQVCIFQTMSPNEIKDSANANVEAASVLCVWQNGSAIKIIGLCEKSGNKIIKEIQPIMFSAIGSNKKSQKSEREIKSYHITASCLEI